MVVVILTKKDSIHFLKEGYLKVSLFFPPQSYFDYPQRTKNFNNSKQNLFCLNEFWKMWKIFVETLLDMIWVMISSRFVVEKHGKLRTILICLSIDLKRQNRLNIVIATKTDLEGKLNAYPKLTWENESFRRFYVIFFPDTKEEDLENLKELEERQSQISNVCMEGELGTQNHPIWFA